MAHETKQAPAQGAPESPSPAAAKPRQTPSTPTPLSMPLPTVAETKPKPETPAPEPAPSPPEPSGIPLAVPPKPPAAETSGDGATAPMPSTEPAFADFSSAIPAMPRYPPPAVPGVTPLSGQLAAPAEAGGVGSDPQFDEDDDAVVVERDEVGALAGAGVGEAGDGGGDDVWGDDPFDDFQSGPPGPSVSTPSPPPLPAMSPAEAAAIPASTSSHSGASDKEAPAWNLDFFMGAPSVSGVSAVGEKSQGKAGFTGTLSGGTTGSSSKPLDLVR